MSAVNYRPEIDGLRAVAILGVVLFHSNVGWIPGGYLGVDVFFVISGYLITSILLEQRRQGTFTYAGFWMRRIRRIFPALAVMLAMTLLTSSFLIAGNDPYTLGVVGLAAIFSLANFALWSLTGSYWATDASSVPLLHTWTLAVEEQFYLLFPFLLALLYRRGRAWMLTGLAITAALSFGTYLYWLLRDPVATFYLLPTRGWELAAGCLLAVSGRSTLARRWHNPTALAGLAGLVFCYAVCNENSPLSGSPAWIVTCTVVVLACAADRDGPAHRLLANRPMVFVGKISYSLYLWHWPLLVFARNRLENGDAPVPAWLLAPAMLLAATASYYLVEQPMRQRQNIKLPLLVLLLLGIGAAAASIGQAYWVEKPRYRPVVSHAMEYEVNPYQQEQDRRNPVVDAAKLPDVTLPAVHDAFRTEGIRRNYAPGGVEVVVLGDSHALMWANVLDEIAREQQFNIAFFTAAGTDPFVPIPVENAKPTNWWRAQDKLVFDQTRLARIREWKPKLVVVLTRWSLRNAEETGDVMRLLQESGAKVFTLEQPPELFFSGVSAVRKLAAMKMFPHDGANQYVAAGNLEKYRQGIAVVGQLEKQYPFFHMLRIADLYRQQDGKVWVLAGDHLLYSSTDHLTEDGAQKAKERIRAALIAALRTP